MLSQISLSIQKIMYAIEILSHVQLVRDICLMGSHQVSIYPMEPQPTAHRRLVLIDVLVRLYSCAGPAPGFRSRRVQFFACSIAVIEGYLRVPA